MQHRGRPARRRTSRSSTALARHRAATRAAVEVTTVAERRAERCVHRSTAAQRAADDARASSAQRYAADEALAATRSRRTSCCASLTRGSESVGESRTASCVGARTCRAPSPSVPIARRARATWSRTWTSRGRSTACSSSSTARMKYAASRARARPLDGCVMREKRREELICELTGWRCIRITWADLDRTPSAPRRRIRHRCSSRSPAHCRASTRGESLHFSAVATADEVQRSPAEPGNPRPDPTSPGGSRTAWTARSWSGWRRWRRRGSGRAGPRGRRAWRPGP